MASATTAVGDATGPAGKASLRRRLKAWWDGYELADPQANSIAAAGQASAADGDAGNAGAFQPFEAWSETHLEVAQSVWGAGRVGPGNSDFVLHLVKPLGLNPAMSVYEAGCGLGGATRLMAETFGVWVSGMESSPRLAAAGKALSEAAGLAKKAEIARFDPEVCEVKTKSYDCVVSLGSLYRVENKLRLLDALELSLKSGGQMLITDYVLAETGAETEALRAWADGEPDGAAPWSVEQYSELLSDRGLDVRITEDITDTVRQQIVGSWADHMATLGQAAGDPRTAETLVHEVELWTRRVQALQSGDLRVCRLYARKGSSNLLSDW